MLSIVIGVSIIIVNTYIDVNIVSNNAKPTIFMNYVRNIWTLEFV